MGLDICLAYTYLCGPMVSGNWVGPLPVHMHVMVSMTQLCLGVYYAFACLSVMRLGHVAACLCSSRLAECGCVMGMGTQLQFCQFGRSGFVHSVEEVSQVLVVLCIICAQGSAGCTGDSAAPA